MSDYFEFINSVKILSGTKAIEKIPYEMKFYKCMNPLFLSDDNLKENGLVDSVIKILKTINIVNIFTNIPRDSSTDTIAEIVEIYKTKKCDCIIALGGGSIIDTAKGVRYCISQNKKLEELMGNENVSIGTLVPFFVIPTTCGTGSECTSVAVIKNSKTDIKMEFISPQLLPNVAIIDGRMFKALPISLVASTSIDALTHAIESYSGLQKNIISDVYATTAITLISKNIVSATLHPDDKTFKTNLALASTLAGISFSNSMVGLVHAIGHACGSICNVPHGNAMAILLPTVLRYNKETNDKDYSELLLYLAGSEIYAKTMPYSRANEMIRYVEKILFALHEITGLKLSLSEYGVTEKDLPNIADCAINDGAILTNSITADKNEIIKILKECL